MMHFDVSNCESQISFSKQGTVKDQVYKDVEKDTAKVNYLILYEKIRSIKLRFLRSSALQLFVFSI